MTNTGIKRKNKIKYKSRRQKKHKHILQQVKWRASTFENLSSDHDHINKSVSAR